MTDRRMTIFEPVAKDLVGRLDPTLTPARYIYDLIIGKIMTYVILT